MENEWFLLQPHWIMSSEEDIRARHRKEVKELTGKTTAMKKQATKSTKKEVMKQIQQLEDEMKQRHIKELAGDGSEEKEEFEEITPEQLLAQMNISEEPKNVEPVQSTPKQQPKRRNRQKERLAKREAEIARIQEEARLEQDKQPDLRGIELRNIQDLCDLQKVKQHDIIPDGHCLFSSISDQLKIRHNIEVDVYELRKNAAEYIKENPDDFIPFLFDEETMTIRNIDEYTDKLVNTVMWGGDLEILALSKVYDCPITVMMSGRAPLRMNEDGENVELKLVYYQHAFGLGEHYNSLHDL